MPSKKYRVRLSSEERQELWCPGVGRQHTNRPRALSLHYGPGRVRHTSSGEEKLNGDLKAENAMCFLWPCW